MAYRFQRRETVAAAVRRIAAEQVAALVEALADEAGSGIHTARKRCKMLRALIALVERATDPAAARRADGALRKIAHALAPVRDAEVRQATCETLLAQAGSQTAQRFPRVQAALRAQAATARRLTLTAADLRDVAAMTATAQTRLTNLTLTQKGWRSLGPGLLRTYRRGRQALGAALDDPSPELRHRWRKRVKLLWYHLRLLHGAQPRKLGALARQLETLAELLGEEHDLALLRQHLAKEGRRSRARAEYDGVVALIDRRRTDLRRAADRLGRTIYKAKPAEFGTRLKRLWRRWRD